jgi:hypothetical protein
MNGHINHQMKISNVHESGAQEWLCLECERRVLITWNPGFKRIVLEPGDERAVHSGSFGGTQLGESTVQKDDDSTFFRLPNHNNILH